MEKIKQKIKNWIESEKGKDILIVIIVILVGLASFGLGRLSKTTSSSGIKILPAVVGEYPEQNKGQEANVKSIAENMSKPAFDINDINDINSINKNFFASNRGTKYYSIGCSGGKTIKQENRVYFSTREEAEGAGYELSSSCQ